jgi:hypothetical protein
MLSYNRHLDHHHKRMNEYREMIISQDKGSWIDIQKQKSAG